MVFTTKMMMIYIQNQITTTLPEIFFAHNVKWCGGQFVGNDISNMAQACEGANDGCNPILNVMECKFGTVAEKNAFCTCMDTAYAASGSACANPSCASAYVPTCQAETKTWGGNCSANIPATTENTNTAAIVNSATQYRVLRNFAVNRAQLLLHFKRAQHVMCRQPMLDFGTEQPWLVVFLLILKLKPRRAI